MKIDFTAITALIAAIAAIIAPTITALIHSIVEYRIAKLNCTIESRLKHFQTFSKAYLDCQYGPEKTGFMETFYKSALEFSVICKHRSVRRNIFLLANQVKLHGASISTDRLYERCIRLISREF